MRRTFLIAAALASCMPAFAADPSPADLGLTSLRAKNHVEALQLFAAGADQGDPLSTFYLAGMYLRGEGVQRDGEKAVALYRRAADAADATPLFGSTVSGQAMYALAMTYQRGTRDVRIDQAEALRWYKRWTATVAPSIVARFPLPRPAGNTCSLGNPYPNGRAPGDYSPSPISDYHVSQDIAALCNWRIRSD